MRLVVIFFFSCALARPSRLLRLRPALSISRGGGAALQSSPGSGGNNETAWAFEQIKRRHDRLATLSRSLADRGLPFSRSDPVDPNAANRDTRVFPDWVVAESTEEKPMSCLIWGDAAEGTKVVRPRLASEDMWCSLSALNDMRRRDPVKASGLWYDKYFIDMSYFAREAGSVGIALSRFLDSPRAIRTLVTTVIVLGLVVLRTPLKLLTVFIATSALLWVKYPLWSPFAHAPLPLKVLMFRQLYIWAVLYYHKVERTLVLALIDLESRVYEGGAPVPAAKALAADDDDDDDSLLI